MSEESTSPERQEEIIQTWADQNDHEVVGWARDLDVSGSVDPFDTPALGPWLTEERKHEWDIVAAWKLDRMGRDAIKLNKLFGWAIENGKTVVSATEGIDLSTPVGRLIANVIAFLAEGELEAIRERTRASQKRLRELGRWGGGKPYYGYRAAPRSDGAGWELEPDPHASGVLMEIIEKVLGGQSTESIAKELNERGELAPSDYQRQRAGKRIRGSRWSNAHIRQQLQNKALLGYMTHNGNTVYDDDGQAVRKGPALITPDVFDRLQEALDTRSFKITNRSAKASPLLGVAVCGICDRLMHLRQHHNKARGKTYRYYQCVGGVEKTHAANIIKADELEGRLEERFLFEVGHLKAQERVYIPPEDHQIELNEAERAYDELTTLFATTTSERARSRLSVQLSALNSRMTALEALPARKEGWEYRETGQTYAEAWEGADAEERRQIMLRAGMKLSITKSDSGIEDTFDYPEDLRERLSR